MATLNIHANNVLGEFGFLPSEVELSFEDVKREFVRVRALEMQKLGISDTDKTLTSMTVDTSARVRDALVGTNMIPAFAELTRNANYPNQKQKVEVVPLEEIPTFENSYALAFYGTPLRYRLAFDAWDEGTLTLYYDAIDDYDAILGATNITFPPNFYIYLECKTALALVALLRLKLTWIFPEDKQLQMQLILKALDQFQQGKLMYADEWQREFRIWKNKDMNEQPRLRRTNTELFDKGYDDLSRGRNASFGNALTNDDLHIIVDGGTP
jgi:hypothetical protein